MRNASLKQLGGFGHFQSSQGSAEATGLADASVDFIVCAQAFHWFDRGRAKTEFRRILKPGGKAALIWNSRCPEGSLFLELYEKLLQKYGTDYAKINHKNIQLEDLQAFFDHHGLQTARFTNNQLFDFDGLSGRMLSSSYIPASGDPQFEPMMKELRNIFDRTQVDGAVTMEYETEVFWGMV
jgi:SAM-dependent methyltransferase